MSGSRVNQIIIRKHLGSKEQLLTKCEYYFVHFKFQPHFTQLSNKNSLSQSGISQCESDLKTTETENTVTAKRKLVDTCSYLKKSDFTISSHKLLGPCNSCQLLFGFLLLVSLSKRQLIRQLYISVGFLGPWVIRPFNFQSKLKIENRCQFLIFLSFFSREINKRVSINISPFSHL